MKQKIILLFGLLYFANFILPQAINNGEPVTIVQDVNYLLYEPYSINSKVMLLPEESNLKLFNDLLLLDGATALYPVYSSFMFGGMEIFIHKARYA